MLVPMDHEDFERQKEIYIKDDWILSSPVPVCLIVISYLIFTKKLGPYLMKDRPAFNLDKVLIVYNLVQVAWSVYMVYKGSGMMWKFGLFDVTCSCTKDPIENGLFHCGYIYLMAKISELLDTVFFVLRKKQNQVTFLHVYHHTIMVVCTWLCFKNEASYSLMFVGTLNAFVHVVMYTYYGLSAIPAMKPYLWWKKYLTKMQLIQFAMCLAHIAFACMASDCPPSKILLGIIFVNGLLFIYLFSRFYFKAYLNRDLTKLKLDNFVCLATNKNEVLTNSTGKNKCN